VCQKYPWPRPRAQGSSDATRGDIFFHAEGFLADDRMASQGTIREATPPSAIQSFVEASHHARGKKQVDSRQKVITGPDRVADFHALTLKNAGHQFPRKNIVAPDGRGDSTEWPIVFRSAWRFLGDDPF
jgi:hypothetical protein